MSRRRPSDRPTPSSTPGPPPTQLAWAPIPAVRPRDQLRVVQNGRCAECQVPLASAERAYWDLNGTRLAALVCPACSQRRPVLAGPAPVMTVSPLLRLRLTRGPHLDFPRTITDSDRGVLVHGRWDDLRRPTHALWIAQGGRCAMSSMTRGDRGHDMTSPVLDHDHTTGLIRGLLCQSCNCIEGKGARRRAVSAWAAYRLHPPAQILIATHGMHYEDLTRWDRDAHRRAQQQRVDVA